MEKIILASASPRRSEILKAAGIEFDVVKSDVDESVVSTDGGAEIYVQELAFMKAAAAAKKLSEKGRKKYLVLAADTVVTLNGRIIGKPKDEADAERILQDLSGREHVVITGICIFRGSDGFSVCESVKTTVRFKTLDTDTIRAYIATKEPMDKAGAYGIQGRGSLLCEGIDGDYFNVVGLPVSRVCDILSGKFGYKIF